MLARMMATGQVHIQDLQNMASNYVSWRLIKAKPSRAHTSHLIQLGTSTHPEVLPAFVHPAYVWPSTSYALVATKAVSRKQKHMAYMNSSPQHSMKLSVLGQVKLTG